MLLEKNKKSVFSATDLEDWLNENEFVKKQPTNIYPIDYPNASVVVGKEGVIKNREKVVPSNYDLGNAVLANEKWIVQYEYQSSYEKVIEKHHQLKHYGPSIWSFYQLPILFFALFIVLGIVWLVFKKQNKQLIGVIG